jgi:hypothetical protein
MVSWQKGDDHIGFGTEHQKYMCFDMAPGRISVLTPHGAGFEFP